MYSLLFFGVFAWGMKHFKWPRPPLVLGFILGGILERYMFISIQRYGVSWMERPVVIILFAMAVLTLVKPFLQDVKSHGGLKGMLMDFHAPRLSLMNIFPVFMLCIVGVMLLEASQWNFSAKIIPVIVGTGALIFCSISLANDVFKGEITRRGSGNARRQASRRKRSTWISPATSSIFRH